MAGNCQKWKKWSKTVCHPYSNLCGLQISSEVSLPLKKLVFIHLLGIVGI